LGEDVLMSLDAESQLLASLPEQVELRAGPVSLLFEDGCIRYLRVGGKEILRRVYAAVRDEQWRTIPGQIRDLEITCAEDSFRIGFVSDHDFEGIKYVWKGRIEGDRNGTITFEFDGEAKSAFKRNRIGFCVLHGPEAVIGARCKVTHADGSTSTPSFPKIVAQEQPVNGLSNLASVSLELEAGTWITTEFSGDVFETEDQRNWIDDSFKTYCTPLSLPLPVEVKPGDRVRQKITIRVERAPKISVTSAEAKPVRVVVRPKKLPLPRIGFCATGEQLAFSANIRLQQLKPAHVRVEAPMNIPDWQQPFTDGFREASALKTKVELALRLSGCPGEDLRDLITTFAEPFQHWAFSSSFARILLSTFGEQSTSKRTLEAFRGFLLKTGLSTLDVPIGCGTEGDLYELNNQRPPREGDLYFWSMNPQVHAFDIASISETPGGAEAQVRSVQEYFGDAPKTVSPITLRPRGDTNVDPRQRTLFGGVWTLGMIAALTSGGATSATFFETVGAKGVMENGGPVFPMYHVFRTIAGCSDAHVCDVSEPYSVAALMVRLEQGARLIVGNYKRTPVDVELAIAPNSNIRRLNKETAAPALEQPDSFWSVNSAAPLSSSHVRLAPFEIAVIDQPILPDAF
jgi:D-apionolactonase